MPTYDWNQSSSNPILVDQINYNTQEKETLLADWYLQLNTDQKKCFETIIAGFDKKPKIAHYFVQGPAGTRKTFLYKTLCNHFQAQKKIVFCMASSEIAALLLSRGVTSHSRFKIPLIVNKNSICGFTCLSYLYEVLCQTSLIIWDKVPMQNKHCFEAIHWTLCDLLGNNSLFGGISIVFGGDFAQILPVVKHRDQGSTVAANI